MTLPKGRHYTQVTHACICFEMWSEYTPYMGGFDEGVVVIHYLYQVVVVLYSAARLLLMYVFALST